MRRCELCGKLPHGTCSRCRGPACRRCDDCLGCRRIICRACDTEPTPPFAFPGDRFTHPHSEASGLFRGEPA